MLSRVKASVFFILLIVFLMSCAKQPGSTRYKGKLKQGKAIPCPVKDC
jgi:hypothetical protein